MTKEEILENHKAKIKELLLSLYHEQTTRHDGQIEILDMIYNHADLQTASLREELDDYKEIIENYQVHTRALNQKISELEKSKLEWEQAYVNRFNESQKQKTKIHSLEQRVRRLEDGLSDAINGEMDSTKYERLQSLLTSPQGENNK